MSPLTLVHDATRPPVPSDTRNPPPAASQSVRSLRALVAASVDPRLSRGDLACLAVILNRFNTETQTAWPSVNRLVEEAKLHRSNVIRSLRRLAELEYLAIDRGGLGRANRYKPTFGTSRTDATGSVDKTSRTDATQLVAPTRLEVVAPTRPELTHKNLPKNLPNKISRFGEFWSAYPRKVGDKRKAEKLWARQKLDTIADQVIADVTSRRAGDAQWSDSRFIPHPTTYLHQQRWNDDWRLQIRRPSVNDSFGQVRYEASCEDELPDWGRSLA